MTRREAMAALGLGGGVLLLGACVVPAPGAEPLLPPAGEPEPGGFPDGVAAGDPAPDGAPIWTRVERPPDGRDVGVVWTVAEDPDMRRVLVAGVQVAGASTGHCLTVQVTGLRPDRWYHYRFEVPDRGGSVSRVGRLRTAPDPAASPERVRYGVGSCQQINDSWFTAHSAAAADDLDFFVHLGDYVYVSDTSTVTLADYREQYRRWRRQPRLRDLHAAVPVVPMWDDGEFYNGVDRFGPPDRLAAARRAWYEAFPVPDDGSRRPHRQFGWGTLADLTMIDVRSHRDPEYEDLAHLEPGGPDDPTRTTLGAEQFRWLTESLTASPRPWHLIGNPYNINPWRLLNTEVLRPFRPDLPVNSGIYMPNEAWDDYMSERRDLLRVVGERVGGTTLFTSGHTHISLAADLRVDHDRPATPVVAHDVCAPSMTADPDPRAAYLGSLPRDAAEEVLRAAERFVLGQNRPYLRHMNLVDQGYLVVEVTPEEAVVTVRNVAVDDPAAEAVDGARFRITHGGSPLQHLPTPRRRGSVA